MPFLAGFGAHDSEASPFFNGVYRGKIGPATECRQQRAEQQARSQRKKETEVARSMAISPGVFPSQQHLA